MNNRNPEKIFWAGYAIISPVIPVLLYFQGNWYSILHSYSLGMLLGIISYVYFLNTLIISTRIRYFDRIFGHDRVLVFHGYMALAAAGFAAAHLIFKAISGFELTIQSGAGIIAFSVFFLIIVMTLLYMTSIFPAWSGWLRAARIKVTGRFSLDYSKMKFIHNFTSFAAVLISIHVFLAASTQENYRRIFLAGAWALICLVLFVNHKFFRAIARKRLFHVTRVTQLTSQIVEINMRSAGGKTLRYNAGQFGYFRFVSPAINREEHPFTISSPPGKDGISITVKNLGDYTARLKNVAEGAKVIFDGPYGLFTPAQDGRHHLFIAGGIGVTPFLSIISGWDCAGIKTPVSLIWSTKSDEEMIHRGLFIGIESKNGMFSFIPVISGPRIKPIGKAFLEPVIGKSDIKNTVVYICGPVLMRMSIVNILKEMGIASRNIHYENFSF